LARIQPKEGDGRCGQNDRRVGGSASQVMRNYEVIDTAPRSAITLPQIVLRFQEKWR